jgi:hypothetical protein
VHVNKVPIPLPGRGGDSEGIDKVVHRIPRVTFHPFKLDATLVGEVQLDERFPQVLIRDGLLLRVLPPARLPSDVPLVFETVHDVRGVADDRDVRIGLLKQGGQRVESCPYFHPLVRRCLLGSARARSSNDGPTPPSRAGVALACAIGEHA